MSQAIKNFEERLFELYRNALIEDVGTGDHTSLACIPKTQKGIATLKAKESGILAGVEVAKQLLLFSEPAMQIKIFVADGNKTSPNTTLLQAAGNIHNLLKMERLVLNIMQRMSGIATLTNQYVEAIKGFSTKILDTRKTTPNFRFLEKEAVKIGGGYNHRFGLYDMILLKDNHIDFCGGISKALLSVQAYNQQQQSPLPVVIETRNLSEVETVMVYGKGIVNRIMLDNFSPEKISAALQIINHQFETEASGGINLGNIQAYAATGVDYISIGALIHQAKSLDLNFKATIQ